MWKSDLLIYIFHFLGSSEHLEEGVQLVPLCQRAFKGCQQLVHERQAAPDQNEPISIN